VFATDFQGALPICRKYGLLS